MKRNWKIVTITKWIAIISSSFAIALSFLSHAVLRALDHHHAGQIDILPLIHALGTELKITDPESGSCELILSNGKKCLFLCGKGVNRGIVKQIAISCGMQPQLEASRLSSPDVESNIHHRAQ